ncbi:hypothetical protein MMC12_006359 [Toensbergia leucococca]|nr:hypothetical protein [Toensbergia leucococca]
MDDITTSTDRLVGNAASNSVNESSSSAKTVPKNPIPTPVSVPPGLSLPHDFPPLAAPQTLPSASIRPQRKAASNTVPSNTVKPVVPMLPTLPIRPASPVKGNKGSRASDAACTQTSVSIPVPMAKRTTTTDGSIGDGSGHPQGRAPPIPTSSTNLQCQNAHVDSTNADKKESQEHSLKTAEKRQHPGRLDITAAKDASTKDLESLVASPKQDKSKTPSEAGRGTASGILGLSQPSTPTMGASQISASSAMRQAQPRTMRVLPTPKVEPNFRLSGASPSFASSSAVLRQPSRRTSINSINQPTTPASERISDNASVTSASISRTNSPAPSKVGSAPVRQTTKSQQKKERQARAKLAEAISKVVETPAATIAEKPVQAPILGRKKKAKKASTRDTRDTTYSTPDISRASSPAHDTENAVDKEDSLPTTPTRESKKEDEAHTAPAAPTNSDQNQKASPTAASLFAELQKADAIYASAIDLFKGFPGINHRFDLTPIDLAESSGIPMLSNDQIRQLEEGDAVCVELGQDKRVIVLPDRHTLRGFSSEQAKRYLEKRKQVISTSGPTMFNSSRHKIDRYLHALPRSHAEFNGYMANNFRADNDDGSDDSPELVNRFVAPPSPTVAGALLLDNYWSAMGPPGDEGMAMRVPTMSVEEAEKAWIASRKETEAIEKKLNALIKRNRRLLSGGAL